MKAMISLDGILSFINSLSLSASNKQWLGERLLEEARQEKAVTQKQSYADFIESMCGAWKDDQERLDKEADRLWNEGILDQQQLDRMRNEDLHKK